MNKRKLIQTIAQDTNISKQTIKLVLQSLQDIAIEEICNKGTFKFFNIVTIHYFLSKPKTLNNKTIPAQYRIKARLSEPIKTLFLLQTQDFIDKPYMINRSTWKDAIKWKQNTNKPQKPTLQNQPNNDDMINNILDEYNDEDDI